MKRLIEKIKLISQSFSTPFYLYFEDKLTENTDTLKYLCESNGFNLCYAMKANSNPFLLKKIYEKGVCIDACSIEEVALAIQTGVLPENIIYNADGVSAEEMNELVEITGGQKIHIVVGSMDHLKLVSKLSDALFFSISIRVNTGIGSGHSPSVTTGGDKSKFGIHISDVKSAVSYCKDNRISISGFHSHIGSGISSVQEYIENAKKIISLVKELRIEASRLNFGGGFSFDYEKSSVSYDEVNLALREISLAARLHLGNDVGLFVEPGRIFVANTAMLVTKITSKKTMGLKAFITVNTGFNHFARPFLYGAYHDITSCSDVVDCKEFDIVGNLCQSGDVFARSRLINDGNVDDLILIHDVGAYGYSMVSSYNSRRKPWELFLGSDGTTTVIRKKQSIEELLKDD